MSCNARVKSVSPKHPGVPRMYVPRTTSFRAWLNVGLAAVWSNGPKGALGTIEVLPGLGNSRTLDMHGRLTFECASRAFFVGKPNKHLQFTTRAAWMV